MDLFLPLIPHLKALGPYLSAIAVLSVLQLGFIAKLDSKTWRIRLQVAAIALQLLAVVAMIAFGVLGDVR